MPTRRRTFLMAAGLTEAISRRPPRATGDTAPSGGANFQTAFNATSVTNVAVLPSGAPIQGGCWVTFVASAGCRIRFGITPGAAVATDALLPAGSVQDFWIAYPDDANFSVIQDTASGNLDRFRSSR